MAPQIEVLIGHPVNVLKDGEPVFMLERWQIEGRSADAIATIPPKSPIGRSSGK